MGGTSTSSLYSKKEKLRCLICYAGPASSDVMKIVNGPLTTVKNVYAECAERITMKTKTNQTEDAKAAALARAGYSSEKAYDRDVKEIQASLYETCYQGHLPDEFWTKLAVFVLEYAVNYHEDARNAEWDFAAATNR